MTSAHLCFFFFNDTATTEIYTLSLHDALPISARAGPLSLEPRGVGRAVRPGDDRGPALGRWKSTRLNSSHGYISYAVFCLKKKSRAHCRGLLRSATNNAPSENTAGTAGFSSVT